MKTVVITGGTDGIGRALALTYVARGDREMVIGTDQAKGEALIAASAVRLHTRSAGHTATIDQEA